MEGTEGAEGIEGMDGADGIEGVLTEGIDGVFSEGVFNGLFNVGVFNEGVWPVRRLRNILPANAAGFLLTSTLPSVPVKVMKSGNGT